MTTAKECLNMVFAIVDKILDNPPPKKPKRLKNKRVYRISLLSMERIKYVPGLKQEGK